MSCTGLLVSHLYGIDTELPASHLCVSPSLGSCLYGIDTELPGEIRISVIEMTSTVNEVGKMDLLFT